MNELPAKLHAQATRKSRKRGEKKRLIADSALAALKELGYANTSLRDIAAKSDLSLGMLHYYFEDKTELIIYCVRHYKESFVRDIIAAIEASDGRDQVVEAFADALVGAIFDDMMTHVLWYDLRSQAMFDKRFRPSVAEIEDKLIDIVRIAFVRAGRTPPEDIGLYYAMLDGAFRFMMQGQIGSEPMSREEMTATFRSLLRSLLSATEN